jgi:hypothetical protein
LFHHFFFFFFLLGHELKGLKGYFGWFFNEGNVGSVSFPLTAVIDFKGYRITAMTLLPISGSKTLIYGSDDAGTECSVRNLEPKWSNLIKEASIGLNLKPHFAVNGRSQGGEIEIASCVDLEGHKGSDNRYYMLDFSRTFPCIYKAQTVRASYDSFWPYYHMMRPEFVKKWKHPLCSDAFSNFQSRINPERKSEAKEENMEIRRATEEIENNAVVNVCKVLFASYDESFSLKHVFHREGLNMRYLGLVYRKLVGPLYQASKQNLYKLVQVEAFMRVLKTNLRFNLRETVQKAAGEYSESLLLVVAANALNSYFCKPEDMNEWKRKHSFCAKELVSSFNFTEHHAKMVTDAFLLNQESIEKVDSTGNRIKVSIKYCVLERLNESVGLGIPQATMAELRESSGIKRSFSRQRIFVDADLNFEERVKHLDVVERSRGLSAFLMSEVEPKIASEHLLKAYEIVEKALEGNPIDPWLSMLMGDICSKLHDVLSSANKKRTNAANAVTDFFYYFFFGSNSVC